MKEAIYAGSFDPWSLGHQYVLNSTLDVFKRVTVLIGINPEKRGSLPVLTRARIIAFAVNPFGDWWNESLPFRVTDNVMIDATEGLVADYARKRDVKHLIRGLRSTSDFEAEFSLYFSNRAIEPSLQTWTIMCPPELIHCSSTYVRTVVGKQGVSSVGTSFVAQALMLGRHRFLGQVLDLILWSSRYRFIAEGLDLTVSTLESAVQRLFAEIGPELSFLSDRDLAPYEDILRRYLVLRATTLVGLLAKQAYPSIDVAVLWSLLIHVCAEARPGQSLAKTLKQWTGTIGQAGVKLIDDTLLEQVLAITKKENQHPTKLYFRGNVLAPEIKELLRQRKVNHE